MSAEAKSALESEVRAWAEKNPDEAPPPPAPTPNVNAEPASSAPPPPKSPPAQARAEADDASDEEPSETALDMGEIAEFGITFIDFGIQNFVSPRCAFKPDQKAELSRLGGKVLRKWFPEVEGAIEPEYAFLGAVALFSYTNYKSSSPEPAKAPASPAGGSGNTSGNSGGLQTEANVDGRTVAAEVLQ